jgi:hypothetical protein
MGLDIDRRIAPRDCTEARPLMLTGQRFWTGMQGLSSAETEELYRRQQEKVRNYVPPRLAGAKWGWNKARTRNINPVTAERLRQQLLVGFGKTYS